MNNAVFDLIVIGGGAGAFAAVIKADELKARTLMVHKGLPLGGTCVNVGCVPSKTLLWAGEVMHQAIYHNIPGIDIKIKNFDFVRIIRDELNLVEKLRTEKYEKVLNQLKHVTLVEGKATFNSQNEIEVDGKRYKAEKFIIATGSTVTVPPIGGIKEVGYITHIEALKLKKQPKELMVVGAGPVGLEFAQMYARFGTKVTILHRGSSIFSRGEEALTTRLAEVLSKEGITIKTDVKVKRASKEGLKKILSYAVGTNVEEVSGDEILLAAGKTPNTQGLGLEKIDVEIDKRRAVAVNQFFQTSNKRVFAVGDVINAPLRLETTAGREGTLAVENALKNKQFFIDYHAVPYTIFTDPQLAGVGFTEEEQMKQMGVCACRTVSFTDVPKAIMMRHTEGLIKMVIHPQTKEILGIHILAPSAGELIAEAMILVKNKNTTDDVINSFPMFPTLSEAIKIVALSFTKDITKLSCCI